MDFRMYEADGSMFLSAILSFYPDVDPIGHAIILDSSMQIQKRVHTPNTMVPFNMHEFMVIDDGKKAMHVVQKVELADVWYLGEHLREFKGLRSGLVINMGIREFDLRTGETDFIWWAQDHIDLTASSYAPRSLNGPYPNGWDWMLACIHLRFLPATNVSQSSKCNR